MADATATIPDSIATADSTNQKPWELFSKKVGTPVSQKPWEMFGKKPAATAAPSLDADVDYQLKHAGEFRFSPEFVAQEKAPRMTPGQFGKTATGLASFYPTAVATQAANFSPIEQAGFSPETISREFETEVSRFPKPLQHVVRALEVPRVAEAKTIAGIADWMTTPSGASQMTAAGIPVTRIPMAAKFFYDMAASAGQSASDLIDKFKSGDLQGFADSLAGLVAGTAGAGALGHGVARAGLTQLRELPPITLRQPPPIQGPLPTGAILERPTGAVPPAEPDLGPVPGLPGRGLPAGTIPQPRIPRREPVVPETPAEPYETSVQSIRGAQAKTIAQIQKLFPKAELSREQARQLRDLAWGKITPPTPKESHAIHQETEGVLRPVQQPEVTQARTGQVPTDETSETTGARGGTVPGTEAGKIPLTVPEPTPDQFVQPGEEIPGKKSAKPVLSPRYFRAAGSATTDPQWWVNFFRRSGKGDVNATGSAYQIGVYLRQLGDERAMPVIKALKKARANMIQGVNESLARKQPDLILAGTVQLPREALEAAHDVGSAKGEVPASMGKPLTEKIYSAAFQPREGVTETGPHHPGILKRLGVKGFETRESRNTPQFGYSTTGREFVERPEGGEIAKATGQQLEPFDVDETGAEQPHSDEIKSVTEPGKTVSEQKPKTGEKTPPTASVPAFISRQTEQQLADLGYSKAERAAMKPQEATDIIARGVSKPKAAAPEKPPPVEEKPVEPATPEKLQKYLSVEVPDVAAERQRIRSIEEIRAPYEKELKDLQAQSDTLHKEISIQRGPSYKRGRIKASAPKAKVKEYQDLQKRITELHNQSQILTRSIEAERKKVDAAIDAEIISDPKQPLLRRLDRVIRVMQDRQEKVPADLVAARDAETAKILRAQYPDITPAEIKEMAGEVERESYHGSLTPQMFTLNPFLNLPAKRAAELDKAVNAEGMLRSEFPQELKDKLNRFRTADRPFGTGNAPVENLSATELTSLKKEIKEAADNIRAEQTRQREVREKEEAAAKAQEEKLMVEAQKVADSMPRTGAGAASAKAVKAELVARVKTAIDKLVASDQVKLQVGEDGTLAAVGDRTGSASFGEIESTPQGKFKVTTWPVGDAKNKVSATVDTREEAQSIIKAMAATGPGKVVIGVPGDGVFRILNDGRSLLRVWSEARKLDTSSSGGRGYTTVGAQKPPANIRTQADWDAAKEYHGLEPTDKIYDWSPALRALAEKVSPEKPEKLTVAGVDKWIEQRQKEKPEPAAPEPGTEEPGKVVGFGAGQSRARQPVPTATTQPQLVKLQQAMTPGLNVVQGSKQGIQSLLLPTALGPEHLHAAELLGAELGTMHRLAEADAFALRPSSKVFDRLGVHNEKIPLDQNAGVKFMSDMSQGRDVDPRFQKIADLVQKLFGQRLTELEKSGAPLQSVRQNYFPGMWTSESRMAFNDAMEQAKQKGIIGKDDDVNKATPQQKAWVKNLVDQNLQNGVGSEADMMAYFTRRPLKGRETFRKAKVFDDIMTAVEFGLRPISNNPIDLVKAKLAEMNKSIMANRFFRRLRAENKLKIINPYEQTPEGWVRLNDKYGTLYGPPTTKVSEYIDKEVYEGLLKFAGSLGIRHVRSMRFPRGPGSQALGLSYQGQNLVRTKFATETSVLAHEIGHQLDYRHDFWNTFVTKAVGRGKRGEPTAESSQAKRARIKKELRNIADMTGGRGGNERKKVEQIAQMVEAYVHAPERMEEVAPAVFKIFDNFIKSHPDLRPLREIKPGIALEKLTSEKYVGLPIMGYRIVPKPVGDIVNNYLSSSLYNNKYFGKLYKGWMATANALNQSQLGWGSAFHAGFTTADVQVSAAANVLKDVYGLVRGNRSVKDLARTVSTLAFSSVGTAMKGDAVLNAWRKPDGVINPRIAQVVKAAELGGGGFRMEHGLQTEQVDALYRDWFSGHRVKAAMRSPVALTELLARPIMSYLVPRQKAGVFAELAWRIIEQNPGKDLEQLTPQFRQAWNRVDARLGQVRYDRLFSHNTAKGIAQGMIRAPGWTGGTIAEIGGAFPDTARFFNEWIKTGKAPENMPDRVAYTIALLGTIGTINAVLTYAFTGQTPRGMDFLAFKTGRKDKQGNDERFLLPTYVKDLLAYGRQPLQTLLNKSHPLASVFSDVAQNHDYYGYEIRDPNAPITTQAGQVGGYVIKSFEPFWTRGERKTIQSGFSVTRSVLPFIGIMPAPAYITRTPVQNEISRLFHLRTGERIKPYSARATDALKAKGYDPATIDVYMFNRLPQSDKDALRKKMSPEELKRYGGATTANAANISQMAPWALNAPRASQ